IGDPDRVFLDLPGTRPSAALADRTLRFASDADIVRQVRIGRHPNSTTRVVLDAGGVASYSIYPLYGPYRLVIDCMRKSGLATAASFPEPVRPAALPDSVRHPVVDQKPAPLPSRRLTTGWTRRFPSGSPAHSAAIARARGSQDSNMAEAPVLAPATAPPLSSRTVAPKAGGLSIARQLGLGVSR